MRLPIVLALVGLSLLGCRSGSNPKSVDAAGSGSGTDSTSGGQTIQDVQNDAMPVGTAVALHGVIVTAIDNYGTKSGDIWVEEPEGGAFSGVHVYGAPTSQVTALAVGDIVDIVGAQKDEFVFGTPPANDPRTLTELKPATGGMMTVTKTGTGTVPAAVSVDALMIGQIADQTARWAEWEKWEGVLVTVKNVSALSSSKCVGKNCTDPTLTSFKITGDALIETSLTNGVGSVDLTMAKTGDCLDTVTGVVDWFFDYQILPRSPADLVGSGTSCPVAEAACTDGVDNDGNGFADCADNGCILSTASCRPVTNITAIQAGTLGGIEIDNVYVVAISSNKKNMWVSTNPQATVNQGVYVFGDGSDITFAVGSTVNIIGSASEFNNDTMGGTLTEIAALKITAGSQPAGTVLPVLNGSATSLVMPANGAAMESVLVQLSNVAVVTVGTTTGTGNTHGVGSLKQSGTTFLSDDDMFLIPATEMGKCYATITGIWTYQVFSDAYGFLPMAVGTGTGSCN